MGDERLGRAVHVAELDVFRRQAFLLEEFAGFEHRAEADAEAAGPVADLDLLLRLCAGRASDRGGERKQKGTGSHGVVSSVGSASSEARNSFVSATASSVPTRGCGTRTSLLPRT